MMTKGELEKLRCYEEAEMRARNAGKLLGFQRHYQDDRRQGHTVAESVAFALLVAGLEDEDGQPAKKGEE